MSTPLPPMREDEEGRPSAGKQVTFAMCGLPADDNVTVPRALLELCLGIIEDAQKEIQASANFAEDMRLAIGQLRANLYPGEAGPSPSTQEQKR